MTVKHHTASTLVWSGHDGVWRLGLIEHPLRRLLLPPGGHVEPDENTEEAALRELAEETGLEADLLQPPGPVVSASFPGGLVNRPWWICEHPIPHDNHLGAPHIHVDNVYVAIARSPMPRTTPEHPFGWHAPADWPRLEMSEDTRQLASSILPTLAEYPTTL